MKYLFTTIFLIAAMHSFAQSAAEKQRMVAILDLQTQNQENDSRLFGAEQLAIAAGFPYFITNDISQAVTYGFIMNSSDIKPSTFTNQEVEDLKSYVQSGGIFLSSNVRDPRLYEVFGFSDYTSSRTNYTLNWNMASQDSTLVWFDHPREQEVILGKSTISQVIFSRHYDLTTATPLAFFNSDQNFPAVVMNEYGNGTAYALGYSLRDVSLRNMLNRDYTTQRDFSNSFEPNADVHVLFLRAWFAKHGKAMIWKHTTPINSLGLVMVTHDIDSRSGMDTMLIFSEWEKSVGIIADYNITTRYFSDAAMPPFYTEKQNRVDDVLLDGHIINSHSVGHFRDFAQFGMGLYGETMSTYTPYYDGTATSGGFVLPEVQVSKNLLEANHGVTIQTFRAGHLAFPNRLPDALDTLGYRYDCTMSTNDIGYSFPYPLRKNRSFGGAITSVYEIGMTISDVIDTGITESNYPQAVEAWRISTEQYVKNHSPVTLLIHPNRTWKLNAQQDYINHLGPKIIKTNTAAYGDYWRMREDFVFSSLVQADTLVITIPASQLPLDPWMSFMAEGSNSINQIHVQSSTGVDLGFAVDRLDSSNRMIIYAGGSSVGIEAVPISKPKLYSIYPNPSYGSFNIEGILGHKTQFELFDLTGKKLFQTQFNIRYQAAFNLPKGVYILHLTDLTTGEAQIEKIVLN